MSELKVMKFFEAIPLNKEGFYQPGAFVNGYLKSEADKVIAKLEADNLELRQRVNVLEGRLFGLSQSHNITTYSCRSLEREISELKEQKAQAEDDCAYWKTMSRKCADDNEVMAKQRAEAFKRERHHKYKRCVGQVENCRTSSVYFFRISEGEKDEGKAAEYRRVSDWFDKWEERWLELAEKFKEAK